MNDYRESGNPPRFVTDQYGNEYGLRASAPLKMGPPPPSINGSVTVRSAAIGHVDGDDYTWEGGASAAFAELRAKFGAAFDALPDVDAWVSVVRRGDEPDLRTADAKERDDIIALCLRCDSLSEQLSAALIRIARLEAHERAHAAAIERTADTVQVLVLRGGPA